MKQALPLQAEVASFLHAAARVASRYDAKKLQALRAEPEPDALVTRVYALPGGQIRSHRLRSISRFQAGGVGAGQSAELTARSALAEQLATAVKALIEPTSWQGTGATVQVVGDMLLIRQRAEVHDKIADLWRELEARGLSSVAVGGSGGGVF